MENNNTKIVNIDINSDLWLENEDSVLWLGSKIDRPHYLCIKLPDELGGKIIWTSLSWEEIENDDDDGWETYRFNGFIDFYCCPGQSYECLSTGVFYDDRHAPLEEIEEEFNVEFKFDIGYGEIAEKFGLECS